MAEFRDTAPLMWLHLKVVIILFGSKQNSTFQCDPGWVRTDMAGPKAAKSPDEGL